MNSIERIKAAISHQEPDHVPYDLGGTTVTSISGEAFEKAMAFRGLPTDYDDSKTVDIISKIIIPPNSILERLKVDTRRVGIERTVDLKNRMKVNGTDQVLVVGLGPVGLSVLMLAKAMGASRCPSPFRQLRQPESTASCGLAVRGLVEWLETGLGGLLLYG